MKDRPWYNASLSRRVNQSGARPPTEDEQANADAYGQKLEDLLALSGGSIIELATFLMEIGQMSGVKVWSTRAAATRAITQCLNGHALLDWGYDVVDLTIEFLQRVPPDHYEV